ncbi:DUF4340 domain-containing protein [Salinimonas marina]|uniref:DUF4340 domain-containing protein n=1 Tax=Salinimonas marina TaxID=2785918 RepID=A0A7S9DZ39_9ALTE|nr:DUF4340 domain-containing protein [Salinimonas marina]QPG06482.1 DUF4340 domain-containing protein [Salinimonas marina]
MNVRVVLLSVLVAAAGAVAWYVTDTSVYTQTMEPEPLVDNFVTGLDQLDTIEVETAEGLVFRANRQDQEWLATHLDEEQSFPVNQSRLSTMVSRILNAKVIEHKTSKAENYHLLGVANLGQDDADSTLLTLSSKDKEWQVLVGNMAKSQRGTFVRLPGKQASLLIDNRVRLPHAGSDWLARQVLPFTAEELQGIRFTKGNNTSLLLMRSEQTAEWEVVQVDNRPIEVAPERLAYPGVIEQAVKDLTEFRYLDVRAYFPAQWQQQDPVGQVTFTLANERTVTAHLATTAELNQYRVWFDYPDAGHWLSGWVFEVSGYQGRAFTLALDDLTDNT